MSRFFKYAHKMPENYIIVPLHDIHFGNSALSVSKLDAFIEYILSEDEIYVVLVGDLVENMAVNDPRFHIDSVDSKAVRLQNQIKGIVKKLKPIRKRILGGTEGNHDWRASMSYGNVVEEILEKLKVNYTDPDTGKKSVAYGDWQAKYDFGALRLFAWHGSHGHRGSRAGEKAQRKTNNKIWVKRELRDLEGDCDWMHMGHIHQRRILSPAEQLGLVTVDDIEGHYLDYYVLPSRIPIPKSNGAFYIPEDMRWYSSGGSFMKTRKRGISTYTERFGYGPSDLGMVKGTVKKGKFLGVEPLIIKQKGE